MITPEAARLADEAKQYARFAVADGLYGHSVRAQSYLDASLAAIDRLASLSTPHEGGQAGAEVARDAARFRYILNNTSGQLMTKTRDFIWSSDMPADEVRAAIDTAMATQQKEQQR